jgi:hypothetical protein
MDENSSDTCTDRIRIHSSEDIDLCFIDSDEADEVAFLAALDEPDPGNGCK